MIPLLELAGVEKRYPRQEPAAVRSVDLQVAAGEMVALLGPSGCGKTTLLRLIAGFERVDAGIIRLADRELESPRRHVPPERRGVGIVFQEYALFPHLTVAQNVAFGLRDLDAAGRIRRTGEVLEMVGLASFGRRHPQELSGGEQQRVALARSLAPRPQLLLLDEPFSGLDAERRQTTRGEVRDLLRREGVTAVLVTHDQEEALSFADRVAVMHAGRIEQVGPPPEIYRRPATSFVAAFLGKANVIAGEAAGGEVRTVLGTLPLAEPAQGPVQIALRSEDLDLAEGGDGGVEGTVVLQEFTGRECLYRVRLPGGEEFWVRTASACFVPQGRVVRLRVTGTASLVSNP